MPVWQASNIVGVSRFSKSRADATFENVRGNDGYAIVILSNLDNFLYHFQNPFKIR